MKLHYQFEIEIKRPLKEVIRLFADRSQLTGWQKSLVSDEPVTNKKGQHQFLMMYKLGRRRKMKLTETILLNQLPEQYNVHVSMKGAQHTAFNSFYPVSQTATKWVYRIDYQFSGLMKLIARFMKSGFEQQSLAYMHSFKSFAERMIGT